MAWNEPPNIRPSADTSLDSYEITPDDDNDLDAPIRALFVGGAGKVTFTTVNGSTTDWTVPAGFIIPVAMKKVFATDTDATLLRAIV